MRVVVIALTAMVLAACGDSGGGDGGHGGSGGRGGPDDSKNKGLVITILGLDDVDNPPAGETNLDGNVLIARDGERPEDGAVSVNGVELREDEIVTSFYYAPKGAQIDGIGAGSTLQVRARDAEGESSLDLRCPEEVRLTSPADGASVRPGQKLEVTWTGDVHAHNLGLIAVPVINFFEPSELISGRWRFLLGEGATISKGMRSSVEVTIPEASGDRLALHLRVPGAFITSRNASGGESSGVCWLVRRVELNVER